MSERNFSMNEYWNKIAKKWEPELSFRGKTYEDWTVWYKKSFAKLTELMGNFPKRVELNAEVEYSVVDGDIIRERVVFDSEEFMSVPCYVLRPKDMKADGSNPAIVCSPGHNPYGKEPIAGVRSSPGHVTNIMTHNHNYGEQMARAGFLTIVPGARVYGEK
ncbi:MAG: alpha/beta hydrolase family protein, partial [Peptostreptococcales bacterium]